MSSLFKRFLHSTTQDHAFNEIPSILHHVEPLFPPRLLQDSICVTLFIVNPWNKIVLFAVWSCHNSMEALLPNQSLNRLTLIGPLNHATGKKNRFRVNRNFFVRRAFCIFPSSCRLLRLALLLLYYEIIPRHREVRGRAEKKTFTIFLSVTTQNQKEWSSIIPFTFLIQEND